METARRGPEQRRQDFAEFWAPDSPERQRYPRPRLLAAGLLAAALALHPVPAAAAIPPPAEPQDLDSLVDEADSLGEEYNGELRDMEGVIDAAEEAEERVETTEEQLTESREQVRTLAITSYKNGGVDPTLTIFVEEDPDALLERARAVDYISSSNSDQIDGLRDALADHTDARDEAEETLQEAEDDLGELQEGREEVQELIADHPAQEQGPPDSLTPRTRQMRDLVIEEFGEGPGFGCYRPHDGGSFVGEHPKGRACDFMMTNDGVMPPQDEIDRGWEMAEWMRENADRLGIMYVIYRQQIWDQRRGDTDWRDMADRGSITDNHFDHVHVSMF